MVHRATIFMPFQLYPMNTIINKNISGGDNTHFGSQTWIPSAMAARRDLLGMPCKKKSASLLLFYKHSSNTLTRTSRILFVCWLFYNFFCVRDILHNNMVIGYYFSGSDVSVWGASVLKFFNLGAALERCLSIHFRLEYSALKNSHTFTGIHTKVQKVQLMNFI